MEELAEAIRDLGKPQITRSILRKHAVKLFDQADEILAVAEGVPEERRRELSLTVDYALYKCFWPIQHAEEALPAVKEEGPEAALEAAPREETA
jgi:hypothetical protein